MQCQRQNGGARSADYLRKSKTHQDSSGAVPLFSLLGKSCRRLSSPCQAAFIDGDDGATAPAASGSPSVSDAGRQIPPFPGPAAMRFCEQSLLYIHLVAMALIVSI